LIVILLVLTMGELKIGLILIGCEN
ncbi:sodium:dicarboxylate symporter, partial [Clostridium botulinum]|nr:sodium:dicarboxylate symporter [Clostridium botulinum]NHI48979.1 sodium:dicarboxylate symporter [Clostridium botulinum]